MPKAEDNKSSESSRVRVTVVYAGGERRKESPSILRAPSDYGPSLETDWELTKTDEDRDTKRGGGGHDGSS